ncbi:MAG: HAMP domain-containing protein [Candidatus Riflebacteria bacterium]|nr:HAMP domain-containing protein [Candidatus Riflebacteria bacterium]
MILSLRVKILFLLFVLITSLAFVFSESAAQLISEKVEETFQSRVVGIIRGVRVAWESEQNNLLRTAILYAESDKILNYSVNGQYDLLHAEIKRLYADSGVFDLQLQLKSGLVFSGLAEIPVQLPPLDTTDARLNLSQILIGSNDNNLELVARVPVYKLGEFIGLLTLRKRVEDATMKEMSRLLQVDLSLTVKGNLVASSLTHQQRRDLLIHLYRFGEATYNRHFSMTLDGLRHAVTVIDVGATSSHQSLTMYCTLSKEQLLSLVESARAQNWQLTLLALTVSFILAFLFSEKVLTSRIRTIRDGSHLIAQGELSTRLHDTWRDELGELASAFNEMAEKLTANRDSLLLQNEERQVAIDRLEHMKNYISNILGSLETGVLTWSREGRIVTANPAAEHALADFNEQTSVKGLSFRSFLKSMRHESRRVLVAALRELRTSPISSPPFEIEFDLGPNRGVKVMQANFSFLRDVDGAETGVILTLEDITQRKIIEQQLYHADKLSSIGQLAASVAHEIKNPLASIKTLGQLLREETAPEDQRREYIDVIVAEVDRLNGVVEQLLRYAKPEQSCFKRVRLVEILKPVMSLLHHESERHRVVLSTEYPDDLELIVDSEKLKQVFLNLIFNAIQAMPPEGGTVKVCAFHDFSSPWTVCRVEDSGTGVPPEVLDHIFDPFFTTKQRGTGLGLAIVKKIIDLHGGKIEARSSLGSGTSFTFYLPQERKESATICSRRITS